MQILARSHEHKIHTVTAGKDDSFWVRWPTNSLLQLGEGRKEGRRETEGERKTEGRRKREREGKAQEKEGQKRLSQYALKRTYEIHRSLLTHRIGIRSLSLVWGVRWRNRSLWKEIQESISHCHLHPLLTTLTTWSHCWKKVAGMFGRT